MSRGYIPTKNDYSLFTKSSAGSLVLLAVYVDDKLLARDNFPGMHSLKAFLDDNFKIKDLGSIHYFLGLEVSNHPQGYLVSQHKYAFDLLAEYHCANFSSVVTSLDHPLNLSSEVGDFYLILALIEDLLGS